MLKDKPREVVLKDLDRDTEIGRLSPQGDPFWLGFTPDGRLLVTASATGLIGMNEPCNLEAWDWSQGGRVWKKSLHRPSQYSRPYAFSPDETRLIAGGSGVEAVKLLDTITWQEVLTLAADDAGFEDVRFSPDGNTLLARNSNGTAYLWRAPSWEEIAAAEAEDSAGNSNSQDHQRHLKTQQQITP